MDTPSTIHGTSLLKQWYAHHHHQHQARQLSSSSSSSSPSQSQSHGLFPTLIADTELAATSTLPIRPLQPQQSSSSKMQRPPTEDEYAALQRLSDDFRPALEGPLLGKRQSSRAIANEYASADPVYVAKTEALHRSYPEYRTVQGDGNCGWRAIAFTYCEMLASTGDADKILEEQARLKSLSNLLNRVGFQPHLYEDFVDETIELLGQLAGVVHTADAAALLEERFNDGSVSSAIITHLRLLTSAWMKSSPDTYQNFIPDATVEQYCASQIEPYQVEIDHIGMMALIDVLIKPAGFAVEVLYLDRSVGSEGNTHRLEATNSDGSAMYPAAPTIYLLYRPGHYDILYRTHEVQVYSMATPGFAGVEATPMATGRCVADLGGSDLSFLADIPGMTFMPTPAVAQPGYFAPVSLAAPEVQPTDFVDPILGTVSAAFPNAVVPTSPTACGGVGVGVGSFRPSRYQSEYEAGLHRSATQSQHYQTPSFKNSHYNPAHFLSAEFQPEIWSPDSEHSRAFGDEQSHRSR